MSRVVVSVDIRASLEEVFAVFTDLDKAEERIPGITKLEMLSEGPFGEGTKWRETRIMMKKEAVETMWVTGFNPPTGYTVEANSHGMLYQTEFKFEPVGDKTRVTWEFVGTPQTLGTKILDPIMGVIFNRMAKKCLMEDLEALRDVCES